MNPVFEVLDAGMLTTFQDAGRGDSVEFGVPTSGPFDQGSWRAANALVGNSTDVTCGGPTALEVMLGGLSLAASVDVWIGISGAHREVIVHAENGSSRIFALPGAIKLARGERLQLVRTKQGLRSYIAVGGGFAAALTLGSRSWDGTSQIGPSPIKAGQSIFAAEPHLLACEPAGIELDVPTHTEGVTTIHTWPGPQAAFLSPIEAAKTRWQVSPDSNRTGIRLSATTALNAAGPADLPSMPTMPGVVQLLPNGGLIVFGPDAPVTGGYPIVAVVDRPSLDALAQARPGQVVSIVPMSY